MEQQINQAVNIALNSSDPSLKNQAIEFINQIKSTKDGYRSCVTILLNSHGEINDEFKFFIFQVIDENVQNLTTEELFELEDQLFQYLDHDQQETLFIKNKFSAILLKVFSKTYVINPQFFKKWYKFLRWDIETNELEVNEYRIDSFNRVMMAIHEEIGDKLINRDNFTNERNIYLKDKMRYEDMKYLVPLFKQILIRSKETNLDNMLIIIGQYVSWMEISLFIENDFINLIINLITCKNPTSCNTLIEILSKKMKNENKFQLINLLNLSTLLQDFNDFDLNFLENLSKLINCIGYELCLIIDKGSLMEEVLAHLINLWPLIFNLLSQEYDEISCQVLPFIQFYLTLSKKNPVLIIDDLFHQLLCKIIIKLKYDDLNDEEEFLNFRDKLKYLQDLIASLSPKLYLEILPITIKYLLFDEARDEARDIQFGIRDWSFIELGLYELNNFSELLKNNLINLPKQEITTSKWFQLANEFFCKLINLDLKCFDHELIQLNLFEILVRNYNYLLPDLKNNLQIIHGIFQIFQTMGLINSNSTIQKKSWYQFLKFLKSIKPGIINNEFVIEELLNHLIVNELIKISDDETEFTNQLYLFESIGIMISISDISPETQLKLLDLIVAPIFNDLQRVMGLNQPTNPQFLQINHNLMALGTFIKGFNEHPKKFSDIILTKFHQCSTSIIIVLENFQKIEMIRESCRYSFARLIPLLGDLIINELNKLILLTLSVELSIIELMEFIAFINQIIHSYNNGNIYNLLNNSLSPLINKIFKFLKQIDKQEDDYLRDLNYLKKLFLTLISTIITNHKTSLLITETNKTLLPDLLSKIFELCYDSNFQDFTINKLSITQLVNFSSIFRNGKIIDDLDIFNNPSLEINGIDNYLINNSISLSFELPFKLGENKMILNEISLLLKTLQKNPEFPNYLVNYLTEKGLNENLKIDFVNNLIKMDLKEFRKFFNEFMIQLKSVG